MKKPIPKSNHIFLSSPSSPPRNAINAFNTVY